MDTHNTPRPVLAGGLRSRFHARFSPRAIAIMQALLVTFIWSASWVLIKIGLEEIPALTFAGLRYFLAFLCLVPLAWRQGVGTTLRGMPGRMWLQLAVLGLLAHAITAGTQFLTLDYLPSATFSLLLNFSALIVAFLGILFLGERLTGRQWGGMAVFLVGALIFFYPLEIPAGQSLGYLFALLSLSATAVSSVVGRAVNRDSALSPLVITVTSMGFGSVLLLAAGLLAEPWPTLSAQSWLIIIWLAVVHTAFTFTLWNRTLRTLTAAESTVINNTMLIQIALLTWVFLGEALTGIEVAGLLLAAVGIFVFQWRKRRGRRWRG